MSVSHIALGGRPHADMPQATGEVAADRRDSANEAALQALVSGTKQRLALIEKTSAPSAIDRFEQSLTEGVYAVILAVTVGAWTVLGFVVWMPLLVRSTTLLAGTVFYVTLFRDHARLASAQEWIRFAVRFYARGFEHFIGFYRQRREPETPVGLFEPLKAMTRADFLVEGAWLAAIWTATVVAANAAATAVLGG